MKAKKKTVCNQPDSHEMTASEQRSIVRSAFSEGAMAVMTAVQAVLKDAYTNPESRLKHLTPAQIIGRYAESIHSSVMTNFENDRILRDMDESHVN